MNPQMRELYQEVILDHNKKPRNFHVMEHPDREMDGYNPLCGDKVTLYLRLDGERVADVSFDGQGCAISTASTSMMTEAIKGKSVDEVRKLFGAFRDLVTGEEADEETLGKLRIFQGVREFPSRVKCATLSWHALNTAVSGGHDTVTTE